MAVTEGRWEGNTPFPDMHLFFGADQFTDFAAVSTLPAAPAAGLLFKTVPASAASKFFITPEIMLRSGIFALSSYAQEQFGTAASVPGPSAVPNTSDPLALPPGFPPMVAANMPTLGAIQRGPIPKGIQINSIDVIYQVLTVNATAATVGLTRTLIPGGAAPTVTNIIALGANGLPTAIQANVTPTNVPVVNPGMIIFTNDTQPIVNVNLTAAAGGTINFYGVVLHCSFNLN